MLFPLRRWSLRVVEKMNIPVRSAEATEIVEMLVWGAKQSKSLISMAGDDLLTKSDHVLLIAISMWSNPMARTSLSRKLQISELEADQLLQKCKFAGREVAVEHGLSHVVNMVDYGSVRAPAK